MPTEDTTGSTSTTSTGTGETPPESTGQQPQTTPETGGNGQQQQTTTSSTPEEPARLSDDHPLVKTLGKQKTDIVSLKQEITELRGKTSKVSQLEDELKERPTKEAVETLQTRYDRLEAFVQAAGGNIGKALDSRTFTRDLFETDKDVASLAKDFLKANPTATSTALASGGAAPSGGKQDPNQLLRAAWNGGK